MKRFSIASTASLILILLLISILSTNVFSLSAPQRVIIDTDPGTDDALAILLALNSAEVKVEAFTVVPGNVVAAQGLENALKIVSLAGRCDIPVAGGAQHPLNQKLITAEYWHGQNGLADIELPPSKCKPDPRFGPDLIIDLISQISPRNNFNSGRPAHQHRTRGVERSFYCLTGKKHRHYGWVDHRREC